MTRCVNAGGRALVTGLLAGALLFPSSLAAASFWEERPYPQWTQDECQLLVSRATVGEYPWKRDLGRDGPFSRGVVVWYSQTVWKALMRFKGLSEEDATRKGQECRPVLVVALYFRDDPGYNTTAYRPNFSPGPLLPSTRLENENGAVIPASPLTPPCPPFVDKYTIAFTFPVTPVVAMFLNRSEWVRFECGGLGISETFLLDQMRVHGVRDTHWPAFQRPAPAERVEIRPLPFKIFVEQGSGR